MITNYIRIAIRNFLRNKSITLIKILGLALGFAVTFFILIYVSTETSYNDYNKNKEKIFRLNQNNIKYGWRSVSTSYPMRDEIINDFPEIEDATRIVYINNIEVIEENGVFAENTVLCVDSAFFRIFTMNIVSGGLSEFTLDQNSVVLTESSALKYFGTTDIINNALKIRSDDDEFVLNIIAIIKDIPYTSTIKADFISTMELGLNQANKRMIFSDGQERDTEYYRTNWDVNFLETFILFKDINNAIGFDNKFKQFEEKHFEDTTARDYYIQNLEDIYLGSKDLFGSDNLGDINSIYIFSAIAFLVLLVACINYIILSISQILARTKEVSIRKIAGARQADLFKQISIESIIIMLITIPLAFIIIEQFRPVLERIITKQIILIYNWKFITGFLAIVGFVIFIPGLNIVYFLNKISPISILRKDGQITTNRFNIRKILIVFQFIIFIVLVVLTIGIQRQLDFSINSDLGFNTENKIVIPVDKIVKEGKYQALKTELLKIPEVKNISGSMWLPPSNSRMTFSYSDSIYVEPVNMEAVFVDRDFIETFEMKMIYGKSFTEFETSSDWKIIVNESAANILGEEDVIGKNIWNGVVVGIVNDCKFHSVHEEIQPMIFIVMEGNIREMVLAFNHELNQETISKLINKIQNFSEEIGKEPELLSERFNELYKKEKRLGTLLGIFSFLAIFIASIGLLGITIFTAKKQTKNIAVRKVIGASSISILKLLLSGYIKLIIIALLFASPIAYFLLNKWLQNFAYQIGIAWWLFLVAGILAFLLSMLTISWYSLKESRKNPVESLRYE